MSPGLLNPDPAAARALPGRTAIRAGLLASLAVIGPSLFSGCAGRPTFIAGGPTVGQLKTSVSHLEYENAQMKRDLAKLRRENREVEDRLVQQEQDNGDLTARLDDARNLLRERGLDDDLRSASRSGRSHDDLEDGARTIPAGRDNRPRRKPPVARIPGQMTPAAPLRDEEEGTGTLGPPQTAPGSEEDSDQVGLRLDDDLDHHSSYRGPLRWSPRSPGSVDPALRIR